MLQLPKHINTILLYNIRSFMTKSYSLIYSQTNQVNNNNNSNNNNNNSKFIPIYKTSHMLFFIGLNKVKKYQTAASFGMVPICFGLNILGYLSFEEMIYASLIGLGLTTGLHIASSLISNNLVVFVYISEDEQKCRISYISYWGNREEFYCDIKDIKPMECSKFNILNHKIKINENKNKYKIIIHNSIIFNNAKFRKVFGDNVI